MTCGVSPTQRAAREARLDRVAALGRDGQGVVAIAKTIGAPVGTVAGDLAALRAAGLLPPARDDERDDGDALRGEDARVCAALDRLRQFYADAPLSLAPAAELLARMGAGDALAAREWIDRRPFIARVDWLRPRILESVA